mgnify:CR=1 FL=1
MLEMADPRRPFKTVPFTFFHNRSEPMKSQAIRPASSPGARKSNRKDGFALIVTLSLMILLTVIAVGLLSLASISLRSSSQSSSMATARANAALVQRARMRLDVRSNTTIVGVGTTRRMSAVRWDVAGRVVWAWILTIPMSAAIAGASYLLLR